MYELIEMEIAGKGPSDIPVKLYRYVTAPRGGDGSGRKPVLLLHGASGNHLTFTVREGGLAGYLASCGFDPWLLDWRGSSEVVEAACKDGTLAKHKADFNFNLAASEDVPRAIATMRESGVALPVSALGFCMGAGVLSEAIAMGHINKTEVEVDCVVLMTLGLFYEPPLDGRLKVQDRVLESLTSERPEVLFVDPRVADDGKGLATPWGKTLEDLYHLWPVALKTHQDPGPTTGAGEFDRVDHMCNRLSFIYGSPYIHDNLVADVHAKDADPPLLPTLFGAVPLQMLIHGVRNIRNRRATMLNATPGSDDDTIVSPDARERFGKLAKVTLITGALNRLWHRDSIDLMYEWLTRDALHHATVVEKHILPHYGHQDLLWGKLSGKDVYPTIADGCRCKPPLTAAQTIAPAPPGREPLPTASRAE